MSARLFSIDGVGVYNLGTTENDAEWIALNRKRVFYQFKLWRRVYTYDGIKMYKVSYDKYKHKIRLSEVVDGNKKDMFMVQTLFRRGGTDYYPTQVEFNRWMDAYMKRHPEKYKKKTTRKKTTSKTTSKTTNKKKSTSKTASKKPKKK